MRHVRLGAAGPHVSRLGLGCMALTGTYGRPPDRAAARATIRSALDAGITLFDTADFYDSGANELLLREALDGVPRERLALSVKFGALRDPAGGWAGNDSRPVAIRNFLAYSLRRLGTDHVDIYRPSRVTDVPIEDVVGTIADLVRAGHVRHIGLSEAGPEAIRRAHAVFPIADVQCELSLLSRGAEAKVLPLCRQLGIGVTAYGVLSRGLLAGRWKPGGNGADDLRNAYPRFQGGNLEHNLRLAEALRRAASPFGLTPAAAAVAWVLSRGDDVVPLVGATDPAQVVEFAALAAGGIGPAFVRSVEAAVPADAAAGERYDGRSMATLDSERINSAAPVRRS